LINIVLIETQKRIIGEATWEYRMQNETRFICIRCSCV